MSRDLPEFPNLDHLKKQAKVLLRELKKQKPEAKLSEAQHAVARAYGFESWAKLKARVESVHHAATTGGGSQFVRYTHEARLAIFFARAWARKLESGVIDSEHLLLGLIDADAKLIDHLLGDRASLEVEFAIRREIDKRRTTHEKTSDLHIPLSSACKRILQRAADEADRLHHERISIGHFLLGLLLETNSFATSILTSIFSNKGMEPEKIKASIEEFLNQPPN
jgi:Glyoxalase superfamily protein/Clp amino terminal domain, pathogenicity island component